MNKSTSRIALSIALSLGAALLIPVAANAGGMQPATDGALVIDCATKSRPSQVAVGNSLEIYNLSEVYAARSRLMAEVNRACHREGITHVRIVAAPSRKRASLPAGRVAMQPAASTRESR